MDDSLYEEYRGKGIGTKLMETMLKLLKDTYIELNAIKEVGQRKLCLNNKLQFRWELILIENSHLWE